MIDRAKGSSLPEADYNKPASENSLIVL